MDVYCPKCSEPWDTYHLQHDETPDNRRRFLAGDGCPVCGFGKYCPSCEGTGRSNAGYRSVDSCSVCTGTGLTMAICTECRCQIPKTGRWFEPGEWYALDYKDFPALAGDPLRITETNVQTADGLVDYARFKCPECFEKQPVCDDCGGSGKISKRRTDSDAAIMAGVSLELSGGCLDDMASDCDGIQ